MKTQNLPICFSLILINIGAYSQQQNSLHTLTGWSNTTPFEHHVFVENKGQFADEEKNYIKQPILYYNRLGKIQIYFSASEITFRYDSVVKVEEDDESLIKFTEPEKENLKALPQFLAMIWKDANPGVRLEVQEPVKDYFTYGNPTVKSGDSGIVAHAWKKLIYRNLYKGIDVEFAFPEDKGGIEYNIIARPGADLSKIQMAYSGNVQMAQQGNDICIQSPGINLIDHAPTAKDENGKTISASFSISKNTISFQTEKYNKTKTLTIDPWITSTNFFMYNLAYDIDYDNRGNVYTAGGEPPYELQQYDSTGTLVWTYNTVTSFGGPSVWYGGLTVDERSGTSYMVKGLGNDALAKAVKVNNAGVQVAQNIQEINIELWRVAFDYLNNQLVAGAGLNYQTALIDTALDSIYDIAFTSGAQHDMALLALDNQGNAFMATNLQITSSPTINNIIFKFPLPSLLPVTDSTNDNYDFEELLSLYYYPPQINGGYDYANGFNGMAANKTMLVTYDGASLKKWRTSNLTFVDSIKVSGTSFQWGGLDLDCAGNIYAGNNNSICVYDSNLNKIDSIPLNNTVYALKIDTTRSHVYASGYGFVQSINIRNCDSIMKTGINNTQPVKTGLTVFPNPFTSTTTIFLNPPSLLPNNHYLELDDITGRKLRYIEFTGSQYELSADGLAKGLYFIRVFGWSPTGNYTNCIGTTKIVVQ